MEDKIRSLCRELLADADDSRQIQKLAELRHELHLHIERLRARLATYPVAQERRHLNGIPPPDMPAAVEPTSPPSTIRLLDVKTNALPTNPKSKGGPDRQPAS